MTQSIPIEDAAPTAPLLRQIMQETRISPLDESFGLARRGMEVFLREVITGGRYQQRVEKALVDQIIAEIDARISRQLDEILHHPQFQRMESLWRGLRFLVDNTDFNENIEISLLNAGKEDLREDFIDNPDITLSGLYRHVYSAEFGQFGGKPVGALIVAADFGPSQQDLRLLKNLAAIAAMAHAPLLAAAAPEFFALQSYEELAAIKDMKSIFEGPKHAKWQAFRETENARYVGLTLPRFLLRAPYGSENPLRGFNYSESTGHNHEHYLWGNGAFALASRLSDSFARYRWCPNIVGPQHGGAVQDLPLHYYSAAGETRVITPTESLISDRREFELAEQGFIPLTMRKSGDDAVFFSANSVQKCKIFADNDQGRQDAANYKLGAQLPYLFIITRLAHYIKVLQREQIGSWKSRADVQRELNAWLRQYISDQENPPAMVRSRRPLRAAHIEVSETPGEPGWYSVQLTVVPHFKYMGANFTLSLKGKLDKA